MDLYQQFIFTRTYARFLPELNRRETFDETVDRYSNFFKDRIPKDYILEWNNTIQSIKKLEIMPSMRALWTAGKALERENIAGFNCAYIAVNRPRVFAETLYILMNGTGVGFSVERQNTNLLPTVPEKIKKIDKTIVVEDSKKGWAIAYDELINLLYEGKEPNIDYSLIRPKGQILKIFGGRASGYEPYKELIDYTIKIFKDSCGRKLRSIECHDIMCFIAKIVVVGGK